MGILDDLPAAALSAAMRTGTDAWGQWGSTDLHALYVQAHAPMKKGWRMCRCGCRKRETHGVFANGMCMASGCEMSAYRTKRQMELR